MSKLCRLVNVRLSRGTSNVDENISGTPMATKNMGAVLESPVGVFTVETFMEPVQCTT